MRTTYAMLMRLSPDALTSPEAVQELQSQVEEQVKEVCPEVRWLSSLPVSGPYDCLHVFEAPDGDTAAKINVFLRSIGHATSEACVATPWERFLALTR